MPIGKGKNIFNLIFTAEGDGNVIASMRDMVQGMKGMRREAGRASKAGTELGRSFRNILLRTVAIVGVVRSISAITNAIKGAVSAGIEYNEVIEQSRLAIASLISAQGDLVTADGVQLEGVEKLDAAYRLATEQVRKLRIAGIQTAATTKELVDAFQQAVGAGLGAGLTLDEIRVVTIRIAQAAGALGVPYRQLNEEIRSLLGGIIDQNTRISKALLIENEHVRLAKEKGELAQFLLERFEAFGIAGERIVETWSALKSNIQETLELFMGGATFPLFEALRTRGLISLERIFDFDTAEISKEFAEVQRVLQQLFAGIGDNLASAIEAVVDGAASLNTWLMQNRELVSLTVDAVTDLAANFGKAVGAVTTFFAKTLVSTKLLKQSAETLGDVFAWIAREPMGQMLVILGSIATVLGLIYALFGPIGLIVSGLAVAVGAVTTAFDAMNQTLEETVNEMTALQVVLAQDLVRMEESAVSALRLAEEHRELSDALNEGRIKTEDLEAAKERLLGIEMLLARMSPKYADAIDTAKEAHEDVSDAIRTQLELHSALLAATYLQNEASIRTAEQIVSTGKIEKAFKDPLTGQQMFVYATESEIEAYRKSIDELSRANEEMFESMVRIDEQLAGGPIEILASEGGDDTEERLKALRAYVQVETAKIKAHLAETSATIKAQLDQNLITYNEYYDQLAYRQRVAYEGERALLQLLVDGEDDATKKAAAQAKLLALESRYNVQRITNDNARLNAEKAHEQQMAKIRERILKARGDVAAAMKLKLQEEFRELTANLILADDELGLIQLGQLFDIEMARAEFQELERFISRAQQNLRDQLSQIEMEVDLWHLTPEEGRLAMATAYEEFGFVVGDIIPQLQLLSEIIQNPEDEAKIQRLIAQMEELGLTVEGLRDKWKDFKDQVSQGAEDAISRYLTDAVKNAESLGDAFTNIAGSIENFRNLLGSLVMVIVEVTARMIAMRIVSAAMGGLSGGGGPIAAVASIPTGGTAGVSAATGGYIQRFAPGGRVYGPGGPKADKVPAMLSAGEYVIQAASVQKYGPDFFKKLNQGVLPRTVTNLRRFATGGMVMGATAVKAPEVPGANLTGQLTIGLGDGLVVQEMESPAGERLVLKVINKNRRGVRDSLGV